MAGASGGERASTFQSKRYGSVRLIVVAGPVTNFLVAIIILAAFAAIIGVDRTPSAVGGIERNSAAAVAGLKPGDRITALGGRSVAPRGHDQYIMLRRRSWWHDFVRNGQAMHLRCRNRTVERKDPSETSFDWAGWHRPPQSCTSVRACLRRR